MNPAAWIALAGAVVTAGINLGGYLIAWGVMKGTVTQLSSRVASLEGEMRALDELKLDVARLETRLDTLIEQVRDLNASIRWMREPEARAARGRKSVAAG
jgi:outer membrane murein-binding lipoprotein Lpp